MEANVDGRPSAIEVALKIATVIAERSRDPSTKVGCIIVRPNNTFASAGYNGFPRGVQDLKERYDERRVKYLFTCHAEANAITTAREPLEGYTLYCTAPPCVECAKLIIQSGIKKVITYEPNGEMRYHTPESWDIMETMLNEAGVSFDFFVQ
jgi:dCMP deaminase